jgi:alkylated DNA repair dioxygenase AlkB
LVNLYRDGRDKINAHSDKDPWLGVDPTIPSLSFGAIRQYVIKPKDPISDKSIIMSLKHGSLVIMKGESQRKYTHAVSRDDSCKLPRINITFRNVKPELIHLMPKPLNS